jgi:very-short-patch-repair endonuclease
MKLAIANGYNPKLNRGRGKRSFLELSFDNWLTITHPSLKFISECPFKRFDYTKTYFADFYFPDLSLIIELDGTQHKNTIEYDNERDNYISTNYNVQLIRISHKEYVNKTKLELINSVLSNS